MPEPRVPVLTLTIRTSSQDLADMFAAVAVPEAEFDFFWCLPLASRPPVRLAWSVSSGG